MRESSFDLASPLPEWWREMGLDGEARSTRAVQRALETRGERERGAGH